MRLVEIAVIEGEVRQEPRLLVWAIGSDESAFILGMVNESALDGKIRRSDMQRRNNSMWGRAHLLVPLEQLGDIPTLQCLSLGKSELRAMSVFSTLVGDEAEYRKSRYEQDGDVEGAKAQSGFSVADGHRMGRMGGILWHSLAGA